MRNLDIEYKNVHDRSFYEGMAHALLVIRKSRLYSSHEMAKILTKEISRLFGNSGVDSETHDLACGIATRER